MTEQTIETALTTLYTTPEPAPDFVARLEAQLQVQAQTALTPSNRKTTAAKPSWWRHVWDVGKRPFSSQRFALAVCAILLILIVSLAAIGPQRALAALQNWIGYLPGIGFVDLENSRLLAAPVSQTRDGVTLHVEQIIATPKETVLVLSSDGLPPMAESNPDTESLAEVQLRLPDGTTLTSDEGHFRYGWGRYTFPPLPANVYRVTLLLPRLPLVPTNAAPENWEMALTLHPADGQETADLFPQPYQPVGAAVTHQGVTLRVVEVAQTGAVTAIKTEVDWDDPAWRHFSLSGRRYPFLGDDLGHSYQQINENVGSVAVARVVVEEGDPAPTPDPTLNEETRTYAPISPVAHELTLSVDALDFDVPANAAFSVDLGQNPQIGDTFPLDVTVDVVGFPVHFSSAQLVEVEEYYSPDRVEKEVRLAFTLDPVADTAQRALHGLQFEADGFSGSSGGYSIGNNQMRAALTLADDSPIPTGVVEVRVTGAGIWLLGPWSVSWEVPGAAESRLQPRTLQPETAVSHNNITVSVAEMTLTDQVTAVQFQVKSNDDSSGEIFPAPGLEWDERALYLEDNRGQRYEPADWTVQWQPDDFQPGQEHDPNRLMFASLDPLVQEVTFNVPSVLVDIAETAVLDITIPENITLRPAENPIMPTRSDSWSVNIPLTIAGYDLLFTEAWLEEVNQGQLLLHLETEELPLSENGPWLRSLHISQIVGPAGVLPVSDWTRGPVGLFTPSDQVRVITSDDPPRNEPEPPRTYRAGLSIELGEDYSSGAYRLEFSGVGVQIQGPWRIPVTLP